MGNACSQFSSENNQDVLIPAVQEPSSGGCLDTSIDEGQISEEPMAPLKKFIEQTHRLRVIEASNNLPFHVARSRKPSSKTPARHSCDATTETNKMESRFSLPPAQLPNFGAKDRQIPKENRSPYSRISIKQERFINLRTEEIKQFYDFEQCVGEGSYGSVFRARCLRTQEERAIKVVKRAKLGMKKDQLFVQLELLKQLDHPNIIKLYEVFQTPDRYLIVTQFCKGGSIIDFIKGRKEVNQSVMKVIMRQLLGCLNYLHRMSIVHRDIKLQNVVFLDRVQSKRGNDVQIKLIDFGTAIKMNRPKMNTRGLVGTLSYIPPEIIKGYFTERCDIWSCGVILYILLTSQSPFRHKQKAITIDNIIKKEPSYDGRVWRNVSPEVTELVKLMLVKNPYQRATAEQCLANPWFNTGEEQQEETHKDGTFADSLRNYYTKNNFISVLESYLLFSRTSQAQRQRISTIFKQIDKNADGEISIAELVAAYKEHYPSETSQVQIEHIVSKIDKDQSGRISFGEFTSAMVARDKIFVREAVDEAFDFFDKDKTGFIDKQELVQLLQGTEMKQVQQILSELDMDNDDRISRDQFYRYLVQKGCLY